MLSSFFRSCYFGRKTFSSHAQEGDTNSIVQAAI